MKVNVSL